MRTAKGHPTPYLAQALVPHPSVDSVQKSFDRGPQTENGAWHAGPTSQAHPSLGSIGCLQVEGAVKFPVISSLSLVSSSGGTFLQPPCLPSSKDAEVLAEAPPSEGEEGSKQQRRAQCTLIHLIARHSDTTSCTHHKQTTLSETQRIPNNPPSCAFQNVT